MTEEKFVKAQQIKEELSSLHEDVNKLATGFGYDNYILYGAYNNDGVTDWLFDISPELLQVIKDWYNERIAKLEAEFEKL